MTAARLLVEEVGEGWALCKIELDVQRRKPKWAYVTLLDVTGMLKEDMAVVLYFRNRDGTVFVAHGDVVRVMRDGSVKIRIPWFAGTALAENAGVSIGEAADKVVIYSYAVQYAPLEEAEAAPRLRVSQALEE
jgi:hypothetical protein